MPQSKKVVASIFTRTRGSLEGTLKCVIEYSFISGPTRSGKFTVEVASIRNEEGLTDDLKDALAIHLASLYPEEDVKPKQILGLGL